MAVLKFDATVTADGDRANAANYFEADGTTPRGAVPTPLDDVTAVTNGTMGDVSCQSWENGATTQSGGTITTTTRVDKGEGGCGGSVEGKVTGGGTYRRH